MNSEKTQNEIKNALSTVSQPTYKQYPPAKHQIAKLTELGLLGLMPAKFGYSDAAAVIAAATDGGKEVGGFNVFGEGDVTRTNASALYLAINEVEVTETVVTVSVDGEDFEVGEMPLRYYNNALWVNGGERDDYRIRSIETEDDAEVIQIVITAKDIEKHEFAVANGLFDEDDDDR